MHFIGATLLALALVSSAQEASAKKPAPCGSQKLPKCSKDEICISGTCQPSCTLTTDEQPCPFGEKCTAIPDVISIQQIGFCAEPVFCGGIGGIKCPGEETGTEVCVDNPHDDCDPENGGADCGGICVPAPDPVRYCDSRGLPPCFSYETCVHDPKAPCGAELDCPGVCTPQKQCATLLGLQCDKGQKCVDNPTPECPGGIAADCPGVCVPA